MRRAHAAPSDARVTRQVADPPPVDPVAQPLSPPGNTVPAFGGASGTSARPASRVRMLTAPAEFERCLSRPPIARSGAFALHLAGRIDAGPVVDWRLGLVIPKRYEASAVARNTIKRRWRAAFAGAQGACAAEFGAADLVVRMQSALVGKRAVASQPAHVAAALAPAKRRARVTFDPQAILGLLAERLRRGGPSRDARLQRP